MESGILQDSDFVDLGGSAEFIDLFSKIHSGHDYYNLVEPINRGVPDRPEDADNGMEYFTVEDNRLVDAVFIDGCKSWFGTKYFMSEVCKSTRVGSFFIFQDYAWYTCFWIPAFVGLFRDHFQLTAYVDTTYAFTLTKPLNIETINSNFPDRPSGLSEEDIDEIFKRLIEDAVSRNDSLAVARHTLHNAGALAYIGNKTKAKEIINDLAKQPWSIGHEDIIAAALRSPTYTPDGPICL